MIQSIQNDADTRMTKAILVLEDELAKQRAGRPSPNLLDSVMVPYYGTPTSLPQVASVVVESALMLVVKPWEKNLIPEIERAIMTSDMGLNPSSNSDIIRVPLPALTEERRKEVIKKVRAVAENAKVSVRNVRRDANQQVKELLKDKSITEDDERRSSESIQKLTDRYIAKIDTIIGNKEQDILAI